MKYIKRLLALPFIIGFYAIHLIFVLVKHCILFIRFGGEAAIYKKDDHKRISDIYELLKKQHES